MEKISVIILAAAHTVQYLRDCLHSIFKSTYRNLEIIIVYSGEPEHLQPEIEEYKSDIILHPVEFTTLSEARNAGFFSAVGEFVSFFNAEDINGKMRLELSMKRFENNPLVGMVFCGNTFINELGGFLTGVSKFPGFSPNTFLGRMFEHNRINTISTTLIRSSLIKKLGGFDKTFPSAEEYDVYLRLGSITKVDYIDLPLVRNRQINRLNGAWRQTVSEWMVKAIQKHNPEDIAAHLSRVYQREEDFRIAFGKLLYRIGMIEEAIRQLMKAQKINRTNEEAYFLTGNCYLTLNNYTRAMEEYGRCLALNPEHPGCLNNVGVLYFYMGEYKRSIIELEKAVHYEKKHSEAYYNLTCIKDARQQENLRLAVFSPASVFTDNGIECEYVL